MEFGGAERDRTAGLLVANEALSQLSYSPTGGKQLPYCSNLLGFRKDDCARGKFLKP